MEDSQLKNVKRALLVQQNEKIKYINLISNPGFLQFPLLMEKPEQKNLKLGYVERVIVVISDAIKKQRILLKTYPIKELNKPLGNEKIVVIELSKAVSKEDILLIIERIEELDKKISQSNAIIRSI